MEQKLSKIERSLEDIENELYGNPRRKDEGLIQEVKSIRLLCTEIRETVNRARWWALGFAAAFTLVGGGNILLNLLDRWQGVP